MKRFFSVKGVFSVRNIVIMAMMVAMKVALSPLTIWIGGYKLFSVSYLPGVVVAVLIGPWGALAYGLVADTIGYFASTGGLAYFPGYALSEMLTYFIYACFLYQRSLKTVSLIIRVALSRLIILGTVVFGLNYLWDYILRGQGAAVFFSSTRLINNLIQFPVYVVLISACARLTAELQKRAFVRT